MISRCVGAALLTLSLPSLAATIEVEAPDLILTGVPTEIIVSGAPARSSVNLNFQNADATQVNRMQAAQPNGEAVFEVVVESTGPIEFQVSVADAQGLSGDAATASVTSRVLPGWVSILPAAAAIIIALAIRNVIPALLLGLWIGATALQSFTAKGAGLGLLDSFQVFVRGALADADRASIVLFTMMIGGMVGIITRNGGMASIVRGVVSRAKTAVGGQIAVWLMGLMIFFDDYGNTLVVGNTARSLTDHLKISREKLAYIVDSTAAPVASIALFTTWIGYQIGLIDQALDNIPELQGMQAYTVFLETIPYSFYPILAIMFVLMVSSTGRDFGPMYKAEVRARGGKVKPDIGVALPSIDGDDMDPKDNIPLRAVNAFVPIITMIVALAVSLVMLGDGSSAREILATTDPYRAMMYGSFVGVLVAGGMSIGQRILSVHETIDAWYGGLRATLFGMVILVLAWALSDVTAALGTASYLVTLLADSLPVAIVPAIVFALAAVTAFTTGTSWGAMAILMPLAIPLTWAVMATNGVADPMGMHILHSSIACCLAGAVWGDHCSPISDTTVLSSIASGCNHIEHVRTQLPYALLVGMIGLLLGTIPAGFGLSPWISIVAGAVLLMFILRTFGKRADA